MALHQIEDRTSNFFAASVGLPTWAAAPATTPYGDQFAKRMFDVLVALMALLILSPIILMAALAVKLSSQGPVLFTQTRTGLNGDTFAIFKFRTMKVHQDTAVRQATQGDARITTVGRILRKSSIDELPQLLNVLLGTMSIVGPRPHARAHDEHYGAIIPNYNLRFAVKPGMTGLAQINNLRGETETVDMMAARVDMDVEYTRTTSLWEDIRIVAATPMALLDTSAAY